MAWIGGGIGRIAGVAASHAAARFDRNPRLMQRVEILKHSTLSNAQRINKRLHGHHSVLRLGLGCQAYHLVASSCDGRSGVVVRTERPDDWHKFIPMKRPTRWHATLWQQGQAMCSCNF